MSGHIKQRLEEALKRAIDEDVFLNKRLEEVESAGTGVFEAPLEGAPDHDEVNSPSHYTRYKGIEVIQLTEQMNFNRGNAVKYIARAGHKEGSNELIDLCKAAFYINREIERIKAEYDG